MFNTGNQFWKLRDPNHPNLKRTQFKRGVCVGRPFYRKTTFSREEIIDLYWNQGLTQKQIAELFDIHPSLIFYYMRKWKIPIRKRVGDLNFFYGKKHTKEAKERMRNSLYCRNRSGVNNPFYGKHHTTKTLEKIIKSRQMKPNKAELLLDSLIRRVTDDFQYNGDFRLGISIEGKIPDWVNINGEKQVIELLGHGWHIPNKWFKIPLSKTRSSIISHYKSYGWNCLPIFDYDLKDEDKIMQTIAEFIGVC